MIKVMVVDDDLDVRESLSEFLTREFQVCQASGVPQAIALLASERPDVVIVDFELPPYRGDDLLALVAEQHPQTGRFMLTGSPGRALGFAYSIAHRVLKKGCDLRELTGAIRTFLGTREAPAA